MSSTLIQDTDGSPLLFMIIIRDNTEEKKQRQNKCMPTGWQIWERWPRNYEINQPLNIISMVLDKILLEAARNQK
ncbi:MAG: hypothetical protein IPJ37_17265 [Bacteroidales bacterium]|nr:hypothetical protein [Bacteroidales bacterium]